MKTIASIIAGYAVWTVLWLSGNAALGAAGIVPRDTSVRIDSAASLAALLALSVVCSLFAGWVLRAISQGGSKRGPMILALLLLVTGFAVQWSARALMPVWYHVSFLALLTPVTLVSASFGKRDPS